MQYDSNVDKSMYYNDNDVDPMADDIELSLPGDDMTNVMEFEDGSAMVGPEMDDDALPPMDQIPHNSNLVGYFAD